MDRPAYEPSGQTPTRPFVGGFSPILRSQALKNLRAGSISMLEYHVPVTAVQTTSSSSVGVTSGDANSGNPPPAVPLSLSESDEIANSALQVSGDTSATSRPRPTLKRTSVYVDDPFVERSATASAASALKVCGADMDTTVVPRCVELGPWRSCVVAFPCITGRNRSTRLCADAWASGRSMAIPLPGHRLHIFAMRIRQAANMVGSTAVQPTVHG
eukprot:m.1186432 g.1186432  ORF g.1186432 m.1186432 type:complete len:215 (-) comp24547_c0_seq3:58-702(-)